MNRKLTALSLAVVTVMTLSGCATGSAKTSTDSAPATTTAQGAGRSGQTAADPELQQLLQAQQQDQKQIDDLIRQIDADAGLQAPAAPDPQQAPPSGAGGQGNGGQRQGNRPQGGNGGGQQQGGAAQPDLSAVKTQMTREHQASTDLAAKLTTFDGLVKQAAGNQKALKDAQSLFEPIATSLESVRSGRGFFGGNRGQGGQTGQTGQTNNGSGSADSNANGGNAGAPSGNGNPGGGRNLTQGVQNRIDLYQSASGKLDAAITQLKADLGQ